MSLPVVATPLRCELALAGKATPGGTALADPQLLLAVAYGRGANVAADSRMPQLVVPNRLLAGEPVVEIWRSEAPVRVLGRGTLHWAEDGRVLAGYLRRAIGAELAAETRAHFRELLDSIDERGYPHLLRVWNYLPGINDGEGNSEHYRLFNVGRARAFEERFGATGAERRYPASSAVGTPGEELRTAFLASRLPALHLENPRQIPASRYPCRYGPRAPSFSRATLAAPELGNALFLSGTASIVGHETRHAGSLADQLEETLRNIATTIGEARNATARQIPPLAEFDLVKIYLRRAEHLEPVRRALAAVLRPETPTVFLEADICRSDLALEIEGVALG